MFLRDLRAFAVAFFSGQAVLKSVVHFASISRHVKIFAGCNKAGIPSCLQR
jgi:hypothetical protein